MDSTVGSLLLLSLAAVAESQLNFYQVQSRYWNGDRTRDLALTSDIRSQDSNTQLLQCVMQLSRRWKLGRNECLVFEPGSASPCFIGTLSIPVCESILQTASEITGSSVHVWVTSLNRHSNSCTVIQHRVSNSTSFYRNWTEYVTGFGEGPAGNFWIGLDFLYNLTKDKPRVLRIDMTLWDGSSYLASYSSFQIANASDQYRLISLGSFTASSVQLGDCMSYGLGQRFSTFDVDYDSYAGSCSQMFKGGWWYNACHYTNPNGLYFVPPDALNTSVFAFGINWNVPFGFHYSMKKFLMVIL